MMKHLFIIDPVEHIKPHKDTSYFLMLAAAQCGHEVYYCDASDLHLSANQVRAKLRHVNVTQDPDQPIIEQSIKDTPIAQMDVVWIRTDPPFDRRYFYLTLLLDQLPVTTRIINAPSVLRDWNEKLAALNYPQFIPQTLICRTQGQIIDALDSHHKLVLKPIDGHGGKGIEFIDRDEDSIERDKKIQRVTHNETHWVMVQEFIPEADIGDKRILLVNGEPIGGVLRVHAPGVLLNNLDAGGTAQKVALTANDLNICAAMKDHLLDNQVFFCGIDVIGDKLIEVNVTSPTGLQELARFENKDFHIDIIRQLEKP